MFKALISIPGTEVEKKKGEGHRHEKGEGKRGCCLLNHTDISSKYGPPYSIYSTGLHQKITTPHTGPHRPKEHLSSPDRHQRTEAAKAAETRGVVTFLSQVLGLPVVFCLRKPAVVDHRVGFFLEGSSDEKLLSLTEVERPLKAGSLLRRT